MDKKAAISVVKQFAHQDIILEDRSKFIETVEIELRSLHEGNIARYKLRPSEYTIWKEQWD